MKDTCAQNYFCEAPTYYVGRCSVRLRLKHLSASYLMVRLVPKDELIHRMAGAAKTSCELSMRGPFLAMQSRVKIRRFR